MTAYVVDNTESRRVKFSRLERRGIVLGLSGEQVTWLGVGAAILMTCIVSGGFPGGFFKGLVLAALPALIGATSWRGTPTITWIRLGIAHLLRTITGQDKYRSRPGERTQARQRADQKNRKDAQRQNKSLKGKKVDPPVRIRLPGEASELLCYTMDNGCALLHDPVHNTATVIAQVGSEGFSLKDAAEQDSRVTNWSQMLQSFATHPGVIRIQTLDRTVVHPSMDILEYYERESAAADAGANINALADASYRDLVRSAATHTRHDMYLVVVLSETRLRKTIRELKGGIAALMFLADTEMQAITRDMPDAGAKIQRWLTPRELGEVLRAAFDPAATDDLGSRTGEMVGADVETAGPMGGELGWREMRTDSSYHRSYWVGEWPRVGVDPGFLKSLMFAGDFIHTVSLIAEPIPTTQALKKAEKDLEDAHSSIRLAAKMGRTPTRQQQKEAEDIADREEDLVDGHGEVRFFGVVTVSAPTLRELVANETQLMHGASHSKVELRILYGQQYPGFLTGGVPLGRGLAKRNLPWGGQ